MNNNQIQLKDCAKVLSIPLLNQLKQVESDDPQVVLYAISEDQTIDEQLLITSPLFEGETFDMRINHTIADLNKTLLDSPQYLEGTQCFFYKDYKNKDFDFKVYVQDVIAKTNETKTVILRMVLAYFLEPKFNVVYRLSITCGPFNYPSNDLILGKVDLENDKVTKILIGLLEQLMDNLVYRTNI